MFGYENMSRGLTQSHRKALLWTMENMNFIVVCAQIGLKFVLLCFCCSNSNHNTI